ncbi:MAG: transketolase C-terminal domain-containing protein [Gemmatimonadota bacterium]
MRDWKEVAYTVLASRMMDDIEEHRLVPEKEVLYQFTARGHDVAQCILARHITHPRDAVGAYYRSRPTLLSLGLTLEDGFAGPMGRSGGFSDGRDIGVVCNLPGLNGPTVLPMSGDVGSQYTPAAGWAQSIQYHTRQLGDASWNGALAVVLGGEAAVATSGFWSALTITTTLKLPMLFFVEDNGYGISVTSDHQTPGGDISKNLASFGNLLVLSGDGTDPAETDRLCGEAVGHVRSGKGPALLRLTVPRLSGHSGQDTQAYKPAGLVEQERANDPLPRLRAHLVPKIISEAAWVELEATVSRDITAALEGALARPGPALGSAHRHRFLEVGVNGSEDLQVFGGRATSGRVHPVGSLEPQPEPTRINMLTAIRRTLEHELHVNPNVVVFGEDVGAKGGVHAATIGLQERFGVARVFDTSLSEEGIVGRAVGMAIAGLTPVPEIQFRKYADPATEQLNNCGTIRWRTNNRFAAPIVVRIPGGYAPKCGDPWHSVCSEVQWAHAVGWQVCIPSNAEDAVGLLRTALRSENPTIFFEHRALLDGVWARRPYPGDEYLVPMGQARRITAGDEITVVSWGAMVERCQEAAQQAGVAADLLDLRTIVPWDREAVLESVRRTRRVLVVHEDLMTAGFGAEVAAVVAEEAFLNLDAPVARLAIEDIPTPYNVPLMHVVLPSVDRIAGRLRELVDF